MFSYDVSWIGVVIATAVSVAIGAFVYSPNVLGSIWVGSHRFDTSSLKPSPLTYGGAVIVAFILSFFLAVFIKALLLTSVWQGAQVGFFVWLGFIVPTLFSGVIWAKKPLIAYVVDITSFLLIFVATGLILAFFR